MKSCATASPSRSSTSSRGRPPAAFFASQDFSAVAAEDGRVLGLYILHPNNVGRAATRPTPATQSRPGTRGKGIGEALVRHSLAKAAELGYRLLIFNAVVKTNTRATALYERLGFELIGEVPGGFLTKDGEYVDTRLYYHTL